MNRARVWERERERDHPEKKLYFSTFWHIETEINHVSFRFACFYTLTQKSNHLSNLFFNRFVPLFSFFPAFFVLSFNEGKLSDDLNVNNNKWGGGGGGSNTLLQNNSNNSHHQLLNNNNNKQSTGLGTGLSNHQHHHHALSAAALSSPFSSLLSAGSSAGYLLDPLGGFNKPTTANHLF